MRSRYIVRRSSTATRSQYSPVSAVSINQGALAGYKRTYFTVLPSANKKKQQGMEWAAAALAKMNRKKFIKIDEFKQWEPKELMRLAETEGVGVFCEQADVNRAHEFLPGVGIVAHGIIKLVTQHFGITVDNEPVNLLANASSVALIGCYSRASAEALSKFMPQVPTVIGVNKEINIYSGPVENISDRKPWLGKAVGTKFVPVTEEELKNQIFAFHNGEIVEAPNITNFFNVMERT
jgi:hypothetical protein